MYSVCKLTHPATGVEHALTCHFFSRTEKSLIVACANIIRVFRLIPDVDPACKKDVYTGTANFFRNSDILITDKKFRFWFW
jgi:cleavage and polyadenylation specificity factor subunit 1